MVDVSAHPYQARSVPVSHFILNLPKGWDSSRMIASSIFLGFATANSAIH